MLVPSTVMTLTPKVMIRYTATKANRSEKIHSLMSSRISVFLLRPAFLPFFLDMNSHCQNVYF